MNKDYQILCRSIKLKHLAIMNYYFRHKLFYVLENNPKHMLWFMKFAERNNVVFNVEG